MTTTVCDAPPEHVPALWPHVREHIAKALARDGSGRFEPRDILEILLQNKARLWVAWNSDTKTADAAIVTEMVDYPRLRELRIWLIGGHNMKAWGIATRDMLEAYARAHGCAFISGGLRKGWIRFGGEGWKQTGVSFEKELR